MSKLAESSTHRRPAKIKGRKTFENLSVFNAKPDGPQGTDYFRLGGFCITEEKSSTDNEAEHHIGCEGIKNKLDSTLELLQKNEFWLSDKSWTLTQEIKQLPSEFAFVEAKLLGIIQQALESVKSEYQAHLTSRLNLLERFRRNLEAQKWVLKVIDRASFSNEADSDPKHSSMAKLSDGLKSVLQTIESEASHYDITNAVKLSTRIAQFLSNSHLNDKIISNIHQAFEILPTVHNLDEYNQILETNLTSMADVGKSLLDTVLSSERLAFDSLGNINSPTLFDLERSESKGDFSNRELGKKFTQSNHRNDAYFSPQDIAGQFLTQPNNNLSDDKTQREQQLRVVFDKILKSNELNIYSMAPNKARSQKLPSNCAALFRSVLLARPNNQQLKIAPSDELDGLISAKHSRKQKGFRAINTQRQTSSRLKSVRGSGTKSFHKNALAPKITTNTNPLAKSQNLPPGKPRNIGLNRLRRSLPSVVCKVSRI